MKTKIILFTAFIISGIALNAQISDREAIALILDQYPQATLVDIYKSFFQDRFGPEHIVTDSTAVRNYLDYELQNMNETSMPYYEPTGKGDNFVRVSLETIKDGIISDQELIDAFIESANTYDRPSVAEWQKEWNEILSLIPPTLPNYEEDKKKIDDVLKSGNYAVHHSGIYNELYHPHYRIISKSIFTEKFQPRIDYSTTDKTN